MEVPSLELPPKEVLVKLYRDLLMSRRVEAEIASTRAGGHRGPGEEAIPIAILNNLNETDCFHPNFRTYVCHFVKPGFTLKDVVAMNFGKSTENPPLFAPKLGAMGSSGTLGEASVRYVGAAVANVIQKTGNVTVFVQGDGASNRAPTHEAMAVAAAWQLPIVFVIQNNKYGMGTSSSGGPSLICADTWRLRGHYEGDAQIYRPKGEGQDWLKYDPLPRYEKQLIELGVLTREDVDRIEAEIAAEIKTTFEEVFKMPTLSFLEDFKATVIDGI